MLDVAEYWTIDVLFVSIMCFVAGFASPPPDGKIPKDLEDVLVDVYDKYSNDAVLFEVGCYAWFRIDLWLFINNPEQRDSVSVSLANKFVNLFERALNSKEIGTIFDNRVAGYGDLARSNADHERYHFHLSQLIAMCSNNNPEYNYSFEGDPLMVIGFHERMGLDLEIMGWEQGFLQQIIKIVERYCDTS